MPQITELPKLPNLPKISENQSNNNNNAITDINLDNKNWVDFHRFVIPEMAKKKEVTSDDIKYECKKYGISIDALPKNAFRRRCPNNPKCKRKYCEKSHGLLQKSLGAELKSVRVK